MTDLQTLFTVIILLSLLVSCAWVFHRWCEFIESLLPKKTEEASK